MDFSLRPGSAHSRISPTHRVRRLRGSLGSIPNVPAASGESSAHAHPHTHHHLYQRRQLLYVPEPCFPCASQSPQANLSLLAVSILMFWPTQAFNVYGHEPIGVGIRGLPVGLGIMTGAVVVLWLLSVFRGHNKLLMIISSVMMTAGCGALAVARVDNLYQLWGILVVAGLGIGGIVVPVSSFFRDYAPSHPIWVVQKLTL